MAQTNYRSVDEYIACQREEVQEILQRVRGIIRKAVPKAVEGISYQIPTYKLPEGTVIHFAGWKQHFSLYPANEHVVAEFKTELAGYEISKGTIRFPLNERVPAGLIGRIAKFRAKHVVESKKAKLAAGKQR